MSVTVVYPLEHLTKRRIIMKRILICMLACMMAILPIFAGGSKEAAVVDDATLRAEAEAWPNSAVQIIVGANAGGGIDTAARIIAKHMSEYFGTSFVVTNTSGGAGSIAANNVKTAKPDGYTFLVAHEALLTNKIQGTTDFDYDAFDCGGIPFQVFSTCLLSKNYSTFDELIAAAKAQPGVLKFGTEIATNDTAVIVQNMSRLSVV